MLTILNSLSQPKSPSCLPHCFIDSNGTADRKTWSEFLALRVTPPILPGLILFADAFSYLTNLGSYT